MHLGETLLILGALVILATTTLYISELKIDSEQSLIDSELKYAAIGIAQSYIEEAQYLSYDEVLIADAYNVLPNDFTDINSLGTDRYETTVFDDVDDYNGYTETVNLKSRPGNSNSIRYDVSIRVTYADTANCIFGYGSKSFYKIMRVTVSSSFIRDDIMIEQLFTFH